MVNPEQFLIDPDQGLKAESLRSVYVEWKSLQLVDEEQLG